MWEGKSVSDMASCTSLWGRGRGETHCLSVSWVGGGGGSLFGSFLRIDLSPLSPLPCSWQPALPLVVLVVLYCLLVVMVWCEVVGLGIRAWDGSRVVAAKATVAVGGVVVVEEYSSILNHVTYIELGLITCGRLAHHKSSHASILRYYIR